MESLSVGMVLALGGAGFLFCLGLAIVAAVVGSAEREKRKADAEEQKRRHDERLRALELGFPLPEAEMAYAQAEIKRARAAGLIGVAVPLGLGGLAVGVTSMILNHQAGSLFIESVGATPVLYVVWGMVGLISFITIVMSMLALRRGAPRATPARREVRPTAEREYASQKMFQGMS